MVIPGSPRRHVHSTLKKAAPWLLTAVFVALGIAFLPSIASVAMAIAAMLVCPVQRVRERIRLQDLLDMLPFSLPPESARRALVAALAILGIAGAPLGGRLSLASFAELQSAQARAPHVVEYTKEPVSFRDCITCESDNVTLSAKDDINASRVGTQHVTVELSESVFSKREDVEVVVADTQAPEIRLAAEHATIELGEPFRAEEYVESVTDPVDGALEQVGEEPSSTGSDVGLEQFYDQGWYLVEGAVDTATAGTDTVTVVARDQFGNESTAALSVEVVDPLEGVTLSPTKKTLEYSNKDVKATKLVACSDPDTKVTAKGRLDLTKIGSQTLTYTLSKGKSTREIDLDFTVRDTKAPSISLVSGDVEIVQGEAFDPYASVSSVSDKVDGGLARVDAEPADNGEGWYTITGAYDTGTVGTYDLTVLACDRNGNRSTKELTLRVKAAPVASSDYQTGGPAAAGTSYVINTNTGKFHHPSCRDVKRIADHNRWDVVMTRDEIVGRGYSPCGHCHP